LRQYRGIEVEMRIIKTGGDRFLDVPIPEVGQRCFHQGNRRCVARWRIDLAVHSMKDLPTDLPDGLAIVAVPKREDARDVLVARSKCRLGELAAGARVGTGSLRRRAQLLYHRADLIVAPVRGNIDTRLRKLDEGEMDALVMAAAGLKRIGREDCVGEYLSDEVCVSAVAQGALAIEARDNAAIRELLAFLHDAEASTEVSAERLSAVLAAAVMFPLERAPGYPGSSSR
jgi:hydroxymethylbilane synthase